jgi:hypothetical protein
MKKLFSIIILFVVLQGALFAQANYPGRPTGYVLTNINSPSYSSTIQLHYNAQLLNDSAIAYTTSTSAIYSIQSFKYDTAGRVTMITRYDPVTHDILRQTINTYSTNQNISTEYEYQFGPSTVVTKTDYTWSGGVIISTAVSKSYDGGSFSIEQDIQDQLWYNFPSRQLNSQNFYFSSSLTGRETFTRGTVFGFNYVIDLTQDYSEETESYTNNTRITDYFQSGRKVYNRYESFNTDMGLWSTVNETYTNYDNQGKILKDSSSDGQITTYLYSGNNLRTSNPLLTTQEEMKLDLSMFPNPATNGVSFKSDKLIESIEIMNLLGEVVVTESPNSMKAHIKFNLPSGSYMVRIKTEGTVIIKQLIVN